MEETIRRRDLAEDTIYATYTHPEQMDVEACNKKFYSRIKDGHLTQQWYDSIQRIQGVPCMTDPYWICGKATASDCESLGRVNSQFMTSEKMTPEKYAEIWEGWSQ